MMMMSPGETEEFALDLKENTDLSYSLDEEGAKKLSEEALYTMLKNDTVLLYNDTLQDFYDEQVGEHTGKLSDIKELISTKEYGDAADQLALLPYANDAEVTNKSVFEILNKVEQREAYSLTADEMETLQIIANECPLHYGQAVYSARVLISTQYGYETSYWDDDIICTSEASYRKANPNHSTITYPLVVKDFTIYPNPASTELNFKVKNSDHCMEGANTKIEILDFLGNMVIKKEYDGYIQTGKLNISILANGAYIDTSLIDTLMLCLHDSVQFNNQWYSTDGLYTDMIGGLPVKRLIQHRPESASYTFIDVPFAVGDTVQIGFMYVCHADSFIYPTIVCDSMFSIGCVREIYLWPIVRDTVIDQVFENIYGCDSTVRYRVRTHDTVSNIGIGPVNEGMYSLAIYPNPANDLINIRMRTNSVEAIHFVVEVYDYVGKKIELPGHSSLTNAAKSQEVHFQLQIGDISDGMYFVRIVDSNHKVVGSGKFVKE